MRNKIKRIAVWTACAVWLTPTWVSAQQTAIQSPDDRVHPVWAVHGMVASQEAAASRIGIAVLQGGGNAVDAAVAVGFALAVTLPRAGNIGGGGFMLIHHAASGETAALDYREAAPAAAHGELFLGEDGEVDRNKAWFSHLSAGVPGTVAGLAAALERYGTRNLAEMVAPAVVLARDGIAVTPELARSLARRQRHFANWPASAAIFLKPDGSPLAPGDRLVQSDLAETLSRIAADGPQAFYAGPIAAKIAADMAAHGGLITADDLAAYRAIWRQPVRGRYRGFEIVSMPPPSSGGVHLIQILNVLEGYCLSCFGPNAADTIHHMAEAMKLAYADRSRYLGDSDFWPVPVAGLVSPGYAAALRRTIDPAVARPAADIAPGAVPGYESDQTTHYTVIDRHGNVVTNTYTLNFGYGSGIVAAGTGILLNNEMDDFSSKPGSPNAYGLIGGAANAIEPGKRPLSSMTPTIVFKDGEPYLATGSPGGSRIITTTLQIVLNVIDHGMNIAEATYATRVHHQWLPDELRVEEGLSPDTVKLLEQRGHTVVAGRTMGSTQSIMRTADGLLGASDPRVPDALTVGY